MHLAIILVDPKRAANVGAVARAMKNFGMSDLRIVGSCTALPGGADHAEARALAWNAFDVLEMARRHEHLADAVSDLHFVGAATSRAEAGRDALTARAFAEEGARSSDELRAGCIFGTESSGLSDAQLRCARVAVRIETRTEQPSLNLAQAAVVIAHEWSEAHRERDRVAAPLAVESATFAQEGHIERLFAMARELGLDAGYLNEQAPDHVLGELRRVLARARPTEREVELLLALVSQLKWAVRNRAR